MNTYQGQSFTTVTADHSNAK